MLGCHPRRRKQPSQAWLWRLLRQLKKAAVAQVTSCFVSYEPEHPPPCNIEEHKLKDCTTERYNSPSTSSGGCTAITTSTSSRGSEGGAGQQLLALTAAIGAIRPKPTRVQVHWQGRQGAAVVLIHVRGLPTCVLAHSHPLYASCPALSLRIFGTRPGEAVGRLEVSLGGLHAGCVCVLPLFNSKSAPLPAVEQPRVLCAAPEVQAQELSLLPPAAPSLEVVNTPLQFVRPEDMADRERLWAATEVLVQAHASPAGRARYGPVTTERLGYLNGHGTTRLGTCRVEWLQGDASWHLSQDFLEASFSAQGYEGHPGVLKALGGVMGPVPTSQGQGMSLKAVLFEHMKDGSLHQVMQDLAAANKRLPSATRHSCLLQLLDVVMHFNQRAKRTARRLDLHPSMVFMDVQGEATKLKINAFGNWENYDLTRGGYSQPFCDRPHPHYLAPELVQIEGKTFRRVASRQRANVWSIGMLMLELRDGPINLSGMSAAQILDKMRNMHKGVVPWAARQHTPTCLALPATGGRYEELMFGCLRVNPWERPDLHNVKMELEDLMAGKPARYTLPEQYVPRPPSPPRQRYAFEELKMPAPRPRPSGGAGIAGGSQWLARPTLDYHSQVQPPPQAVMPAWSLFSQPPSTRTHALPAAGRCAAVVHLPEDPWGQHL